MQRNVVRGLFVGLVGLVVLGVMLTTADSAGARGQVPPFALPQPDRPADVQALSAATPLTTTFSYQGQLKQNGSPVTNPACQIAFRLYDDPTVGNLIGSPLTPTLPINNGLFTAGLNFGDNVLDGNGRWLDMQVNCGSGFVALTPRQPLTAVPYAFALPGLYTQPNPTSPNVIGGYSGNVISSTVVGGVIGGGGQSGYENRVQANYATVGGGWFNTASGLVATVGGGGVNTASGYHATVGGGGSNTASGSVATVGGGWVNTAGADYATVGGGASNTASGSYATVSGGYSNTAGYTATVGGGTNNTASGNNATVGGGTKNTASNSYATVGGGYGNIASGYQATVGGGTVNTASGNYASVGGGYGNTSGIFATVPGGSLNTALGNFSFAAGNRAKANHNGAFVWGDSTEADIASSAPNQFLVRASGGIDLYPVSGSCSLSAGVGGWACSSDRNLKENFKVVDGQAVLQNLSRIPISRWNSIGQDTAIQHIGPMAQDFYAAFNLGEDNLHINTVDAQGIALAAIQGLNQSLQAKDAQIEALQKQNADMQARLTKLEQNTQPAAFNAFNLLSVLACGGFALTWIQQRRAKHGEHEPRGPV